MDYVKAIRRGNREEELSREKGFTSKRKVHKSKKQYKRVKLKPRDISTDYDH